MSVLWIHLPKTSGLRAVSMVKRLQRHSNRHLTTLSPLFWSIRTSTTLRMRLFKRRKNPKPRSSNRLFQGRPKFDFSCRVAVPPAHNGLNAVRSGYRKNSHGGLGGHGVTYARNLG